MHDPTNPRRPPPRPQPAPRRAARLLLVLGLGGVLHAQPARAQKAPAKPSAKPSVKPAKAPGRGPEKPPAPSQGTPSGIPDTTQALPVLQAQAKTARRALVVDFGAAWCGPCQLFERDVLPQPVVRQALAQVVFAHYDAEHEPGKAAARALRIVGYPTFVALDQDGREISRIEGYQGAADFVGWLGRVAEDSEPSAALRARLAQQPSDAEALATLGRRAERAGDPDGAIGLLERAQAALSTTTPANAMAPERRAALASGVDWDLRMVRLRKLLRDEPRRALSEHLMQYPAGPSADKALRALSRLGPADAKARQAFARYVEAHRAPAQSEALNQAVYHLLRADAYDEAEQAARHLLSLDGKSALYLDTLAEVMHLRGRRDEAVRISDESLRMLAAAPGGDPAKLDPKEAQQIRAALEKNRARFARGQHELPAELRGEPDELQPWE